MIILAVTFGLFKQVESCANLIIGSKIMADKGLQILVMVLFSVLGIAALVFAWVQNITLPERLLVTFVGLLGPFWVTRHALSMRSTVSKD